MRWQQFVAIWLVAILLGAPWFSLRADTSPPRIVINELLWPGSPTSSSDEWIELRNLENVPVDLSAWKITRRTSGSDVTMLTIPLGRTIEANGYFLIANYSDTSASSELAIAPDVVDSAVSLVNSSLLVTLVDPAGMTVDIADDGTGNPFAGTLVIGSTYAAMARSGLAADGRLPGSWHTATVTQNLDAGSMVHGTPRASNENVPPLVPAFGEQRVTVGAAVQFDATDATDPDGDAITCVWDFGSGERVLGLTAERTYAEAGTYGVILSCDDGQAASQAAVSVVVVSSIVPSSAAPGDIGLSELLPNPTGPDDHEFIELLAPNAAVDISGWRLADAGGTKYVFPAGTIIPAHEYLAVDRTLSKIALNNDEDTVSVARADGTVIDQATFSGAEEGAAYARVGGTWQWTVAPTPGQANQLKRINHAPTVKLIVITPANQRRVGQSIVFDASDAEDPDGDPLRLTWDFGDGATAVGPRVEHTYRQPGPVVVRLTGRDAGGLDDVEEHAFTVKEPLKGASAPKTAGQVKGAAVVTSIAHTQSAASSTSVAVNGWVSAAPGVLGTNLLYVTDGLLGIAVQVNGGMPKLTVGQAVTVRGEKRTRSGEAYILVEDQSGLVAGRPEEAKIPESKILTADKLDKDAVGQLVSVEGEVTELSGSRLAIDDGTGEIAIYIKTTTGFKRPALRSGDRIRVTGIVSNGTSGLRVLPRVRDDLVLVTQVSTTATKDLQIVAPKRPSLWGYGLVLLFGASGYLFARRKKSLNMKNPHSTA